MQLLTQYLASWKAFGSLLIEVFRRLCALHRKQEGGRKFQPVCCLSPRNTVRARTDPYIYSQSWLESRGLAVTWDNPDFSICDAATGAVIPSDMLQPNTQYRVDIAVHNHSRMAAIATRVLLQWHYFGVALPATTVGTAVVDIPAVGTAAVSFDWRTPSGSAHICLDAILWQADDANPLNNVGQHNVHVFGGLEPVGRVVLSIGNQAPVARTYAIALDSYQLPSKPLHPASWSSDKGGLPERNNLEYLRKLQTANDVRKFTVPDVLKVVLSDLAPQVRPGERRDVVVEFDAAAATARTPININVIYEGRLMGGVTAYAGKS